MLSPEKLLSIHPLTALKTMISEQWINSKPDWFVIKEIIGNGNSLDFIAVVALSNLTVPLSIRLKYAPYFEYTFTKIDISLLNNKGPLKVSLSTIKSKPSLIDALEYIFKSRGNLVFDETDFVNPHIDLVPGPMSIDVSPRSYRWQGKLDLMVTLVKEEIDKYLARRDCIMDHTVYFDSSTVKSEIVSALNRQNVGLLQIAISDEWCSIDPSTMIAIGNESDQLNTQVTVSFDGISSPYSGEIEVTYGRKSFYTSFAYPVSIPGSITDEGAILSYLNEKLMVGLTSDDITLPIERPTGKYPLHIAPSSLSYVGTLWVTYD